MALLRTFPCGISSWQTIPELLAQDFDASLMPKRPSSDLLFQAILHRLLLLGCDRKFPLPQAVAHVPAARVRSGSPGPLPTAASSHRRRRPPGGLDLHTCFATVLAPSRRRRAGRHRRAGPSAGGCHPAPPPTPRLIAEGLLPHHVRRCPPGGHVLRTCFATVLVPSMRRRAGQF